MEMIHHEDVERTLNYCRNIPYCLAKLYLLLKLMIICAESEIKYSSFIEDLNKLFCRLIKLLFFMVQYLQIQEICAYALKNVYNGV